MSDNKVTQLTLKISDNPERFRLSEIGNIGLKTANGIVLEESRKALQFPESNRTYRMMGYDSTIAAALSLYQLMMARSAWRVKPPKGATEEQKERAKFIEQCMHDMDHSWMDFVQEAASMVQYGFSVHEKVYRKRERAKGSRYSDGLIGWKKLPIRSQDSITKFIFDEKAREILGVEQTLTNTSEPNQFSRPNTQIIIPKSKILLFRTGKGRGNPYGTSSLKGVYQAWKYRCTIEEFEAIGVQRDLAGVPVMKIPPQYMAADATAEQKNILEYYKNMVRNLQQNQQAGLVLPQAYDPETKQPLFAFELLSQDGGKSYDTNKIIDRYDRKILTTLLSDILIMGQTSTGSYALGSIKSNLMSLAIEARLREIADVLNQDLIPQTFKLNGWTDEELPQIIFDPIEDDTLEDFSKFVQRTASTGMLTRDLDTVNRVRNMLGLEDLTEEDDLEELLTDPTSKASKGMETPFEGTRTSEGEGNDNDGNNDNTG